MKIILLGNLDILGINGKRVSLDKFVNNYGNNFLMLCQNLNLLVANGRLGKDKNVGALTCKVSSLVDYCILTPELFSYVATFEILPCQSAHLSRQGGKFYSFCSATNFKMSSSIT
jgi:hypothetical protein